jgi:hypothetical protein
MQSAAEESRLELPLVALFMPLVVVFPMLTVPPLLMSLLTTMVTFGIEAAHGQAEGDGTHGQEEKTAFHVGLLVGCFIG